LIGSLLTFWLSKIMSQMSKSSDMSLVDSALDFKASSSTIRRVMLPCKSLFNPLRAPLRFCRARADARSALLASFSIMSVSAEVSTVFSGAQTSPVATCPIAMPKIRSSCFLKYGEGSDRISCIRNLNIVSFRNMPSRIKHSQAFRRTLSALPSWAYWRNSVGLNGVTRLMTNFSAQSRAVVV
jgi:hypothetical protein